MNTIKQRAHQYAIEHQHKADGIALMRAYVAGATDERQRTKVFISGKVSGEEYYVAYQTFANAERKLQQKGYATVNPMKICRKNWSWLRCMAKCLWAIMFCRKIHQLPNWQESRGARIEYKWAKFLRKRFLYSTKNQRRNHDSRNLKTYRRDRSFVMHRIRKTHNKSE